MSDVTIYGFPASTYVRTARLVCEEKGVAHTLEPLEFGAPSHRALHPFLRMPSMRHGDFALYETAAIAVYIDEGFDGPALQPELLQVRARMHQWISAINDYLDRSIVREILLPRLLDRVPEGKTVDEVVAAAEPKAREGLAVVEATLTDTPFLAGTALSLADLFLLPIVFWLGKVPEGEAMLPEFPLLGHWYERLAERPSFAATLPPPPPDRAAAE